MPKNSRMIAETLNHSVNWRKHLKYVTGKAYNGTVVQFFYS